jgi:hypothetical protein
MFFAFLGAVACAEDTADVSTRALRALGQGPRFSGFVTALSAGAAAAWQGKFFGGWFPQSAADFS